MYFIIETKEQLDQIPQVDRCFIELVLLSEETHPVLNSPCVLYYNDFNKGYILPIRHSETFSLNLEDIQQFLQKIPKVYLLDKKRHSYFLDLPQAIDVYYTVLDSENEIKDFHCYTPVHLDFYSRFKYTVEVNTIIPVSKHYERCECMFENVKRYIGRERYVEWQENYIQAYTWVEKQGLLTDERVFNKYFEPIWKSRSLRESRIYTSYNLYNITSRPTNAFNGINFLAFNKENHSRAAFIPENDAFVEFDFDGYHLRLIANRLNVELPQNVSIHTFLGQQYFSKAVLTPEEYQESKKITFRQMYNGVENAYTHIPLFKAIVAFVDDLWDTLQYGGYIELPNGRHLKNREFTPQKLFNYYVQCLETVNNVEKLLKLRELFKDKRSKVLLVVYDSILIDYSAEDGKGFLAQIKNTLETGNYIVKAQKGLSYDFSH